MGRVFHRMTIEKANPPAYWRVGFLSEESL
jgi:hypothetical protein